MRKKSLKGKERETLINSLYEKYGKSKSFGQNLVYIRKKYAWILIVGGTQLLKRTFDILISLSFLIILSPLFLLIAIFIKAEDGGSIFYITNRVGKWGKEFSFPKFRSMQVNADRLKETLRKKNIHGEDLKFKMEHDPRTTKFGRLLRKTSMDELPQLFSVLIGDMSLVGPRPPLPEEVAKYTLEQRKRLDVIPGITCIWQVSGRSELSFDNQVQLDVNYIESQSFWFDIKLLLKTIPAVFFGRGAY